MNRQHVSGQTTPGQRFAVVFEIQSRPVQIAVVVRSSWLVLQFQQFVLCMLCLLCTLFLQRHAFLSRAGLQHSSLVGQPPQITLAPLAQHGAFVQDMLAIASVLLRGHLKTGTPGVARVARVQVQFGGRAETQQQRTRKVGTPLVQP